MVNGVIHHVVVYFDIYAHVQKKDASKSTLELQCMGIESLIFNDWTNCFFEHQNKMFEPMTVNEAVLSGGFNGQKT